MPRSKKHLNPDNVLNQYVTTERLSISSGISEGALYKYIERKKVKLDVHYFHAENGRVMWVVEEFNNWLRGSTRAQKSTRAQSASRSNGKGNGSMRQPDSSPPMRV